MSKNSVIFHTAVCAYICIMMTVINFHGTLAGDGEEVNTFCYQCTNVPNVTNFTHPDCGSAAIPDELLMECRALTENIEMFEDITASMEFIHRHKNQNPHFRTSNINQTSLAKDRADTMINLDFICVKVSADVGGQDYVLRGCVYAVSEVKNVCEKIGDGLDLGGEKVRNGKICFCDTDGCNGAMNMKKRALGFLGIFTLAVAITLKGFGVGEV